MRYTGLQWQLLYLLEDSMYGCSKYSVFKTVHGCVRSFCCVFTYNQYKLYMRLRIISRHGMDLVGFQLHEPPCMVLKMIENANIWLCFPKTILYLTHWGRHKMAAIFQTTLSSASSWFKMYEFRLRFHWSLFLMVQLMISQHWFK